MANASLLGLDNLVAFVATRDAARAKKFYGEVLGLDLVSQDSFAVVFNANGTMLRVSMVQEIALTKYTVLGWEVADIAAKVTELEGAGVKMERYGFPGQDAAGIWTAPDGTRVAWFKDPDGNILSVSQHVRGAA